MTLGLGHAIIRKAIDRSPWQGSHPCSVCNPSTPIGQAATLAVATVSSYTSPTFEWDELKRRSNLRKHGCDFADAHRVFSSSTFTAEDSREPYGEQRFQTTGLLHETVVVVTHTERFGTIRIISIRKATKHETQDYFSSLAD